MPKAEPTHGICLIMAHEDCGCQVHLLSSLEHEEELQVMA